MVEETENMTEETENIENIDELAKYRPSKEELEKITKEETEKEEQEKKRLIKRAELREKEKETGITLLEEEEEEKEEEKGRPPKGKIAGTIFDMRFPPLEESAGYCTEHGKEIIHRFNKETGSYEAYVGATKIKEKPAERFKD